MCSLLRQESAFSWVKGLLHLPIWDRAAWHHPLHLPAPAKRCWLKLRIGKLSIQNYLKMAQDFTKTKMDRGVPFLKKTYHLLRWHSRTVDDKCNTRHLSTRAIFVYVWIRSKDNHLDVSDVFLLNVCLDCVVKTPGIYSLILSIFFEHGFAGKQSS